jgi:ribonuclease-3
MSDVVVVFRTHSDIEASVVRGLLETHGIYSMVSSDVPHSIFPLTINGLGEVRISVRATEAEDAARIISEHRAQVGNGRVGRIRHEFEELERQVGYRFRDRGLLEHALTHRSRAHEDVTGGVADNESMEFLGDAVLGFVIADLLFRQFPRSNEGQKSKIKAALVSAASLAVRGTDLALGDHLLLGRGEEKTGGRRKQALIADAYEALIAAIYLDGGIEAARAFITREFADAIARAGGAGTVDSLVGDYKSALQELTQERDLGLPVYRLIGEEGPDHGKLFAVEVWIGGECVARAEGRSKKTAEQAAARDAYESLRTT